MEKHLLLNKDDIFKVAFEQATIGIIMVNRAGIITKCNDYAAHLFGYNVEELEGLGIESLIPDALVGKHKAHRSRYQMQPTARSMGADLDLLAKKKDGSTFPVEISLGHLKGEEEQITVAYINNISKLKKAADQLKHSQNQLTDYALHLEKKVKDRTKALEESQSKLMESLDKERELGELKSRFVSMASHEFRTPLSSILSSAELLEMYLEREKYEKCGRNINRIKSSVRNLTGILNDFLSLEKLEAGRVQLQIQEVDIRLFIEELDDELQPILKNGQHIIYENLVKQKISTDPYLLKNILLNLLSNAVKYSTEGQDVILKIEPSKEGVIYTVIDNGIGIPKEEQGYLFTRFFRASNVENIKGTGLGLTIIQRYLNLLQSTIQFESEYGKGSRFWFVLNS